MVDVLLLWVTIGFLVEATRRTIQKCCADKKKKKEVSSLRQPLLRPEEVLDASGRCRLACCSHRLENVFSEELREYVPQEVSEEESDSLGSLTAITDESEEDLEVQGMKVMKWENLMDTVSVTLLGDRRSSSVKGKEIVEELEDDTTDNDMPRPETIPSRVRREGRGKNWAKIFPEPLDPTITSLQALDYHFMHPGRTSSEYGLHTYDQTSWDLHFNADAKSRYVTGECSKS